MKQKKDIIKNESDEKQMNTSVKGETLRTGKTREKHWLYRHFFKRFFDIIISGLGILVLWPIMLFIAILVRVKHGSPVLFSQPRPGKKGKPFMLRKFRCMTNVTNEKGELLPDEQRLTKFGRLLRKTSLDELPQLFLIFTGKMSIVGPRPKLISDFVFFPEEVKDSYSIRPGFTGLAQIKCEGSDWEQVFYYNKLYKEKMSLWLDIKIFLGTFFSSSKKRGTSAGAVGNNDYYYSDYLTSRNLITKEQLKEGIAQAKKLEGKSYTERTVKDDN